MARAAKAARPAAVPQPVVLRAFAVWHRGQLVVVPPGVVDDPALAATLCGISDPELVGVAYMSDVTSPQTGAGAYSETPGSFSEADKVDVRRFCWYPAYGAGASGFQGWRFFQAYGLLEYRLNNLSPAEVAVVQATYLTSLRVLEPAIVSAAGNLATQSAGPWTHNKTEVADRTALFDAWRLRLCGFVGVPPGPERGDQHPIVI